MKIFDSHPDYYTIPDDYVDSDRESRKADEGASSSSDAPAGEPAGSSKKPVRRRRRHILLWTLVILALILCGGFWLRYLNPYVSDGLETGYVVNLERRGYIFKTWEGQMIVQHALTDSTLLYSRDFNFSVTNPEVVEQLQRLKGTGCPVNVVYERYLGTLPWRGSSQFIIKAVEGVANPVEKSVDDPAGQDAQPVEETDSVTIL